MGSQEYPRLHFEEMAALVESSVRCPLTCRSTNTPISRSARGRPLVRLRGFPIRVSFDGPGANLGANRWAAARTRDSLGAVTKADPAVTGAMREFLTWVAVRARSYAETMDAWRTSCPRSSVWEDASIAGFVALEDIDGRTTVALTPRGSASLAGVARSSNDRLPSHTASSC